MKTRIRYKKTALRDPIMIVGLPGIGNVGSLVGEHLKTELTAKHFASLYSPHLPNQVFMLKSGMIRMATNRFYFWKNPAKAKTARDMVILVGDFQAVSPEGSYDVNSAIVRFFKRLGGKEIYTIGGYSGGVNKYVPKPRALAVATSKQMMERLKKFNVIFGEAAGAIWGSAGMILGFAKEQGMEGACIMGETGMLEVDANSAKVVLEVLKEMFGLDFGFEGIEKVKKETEAMIKQIEDAARRMSEPASKENMNYIR